MRFDIPRRVGYLVVIGLVLLALAGAADSIGNALRDNYHSECDVWRVGPLEPRDGDSENGADNETEQPETLSPQEREECRSKRMPVTVMDAVMRATLGPGIAIVAVSAVFLVAAAFAARRSL